MNLDINRKNILEYLKEFTKSIPKKNSLLHKHSNVDISKLDEISDNISLFYKRGILISPMSIEKDSINVYIESLDLVKQFPNNFKPETLIETDLLNQTKSRGNVRTILLPSIRENNSQVMNQYDSMVAYYLLMGGDNPVQRFSKVEMAMKQYGVKPDIRYSNYEIWR